MTNILLAKHDGLFETATINQPYFCKTHDNIILPYTTTILKIHYSIIIFTYTILRIFYYLCMLRVLLYLSKLL
jgi:hypothetical protein